MIGVVDVIKRENFLTSDEYQKAYRKEWNKRNKEQVKHLSKKWHSENKEHKNKKAKEAYYGIRSDWFKKYRAKPEVKKRNFIHALKKYGLTKENYDLLLEKQNFVCAICKCENNGNKNWHVDHCHKSGIVRGLLCNRCNHGLGAFKDNLEYLKNAMDYLKNASIN